jgi:hypothetical protein
MWPQSPRRIRPRAAAESRAGGCRCPGPSRKSDASHRPVAESKRPGCRSRETASAGSNHSPARVPRRRPTSRVRDSEPEQYGGSLDPHSRRSGNQLTRSPQNQPASACEEARWPIERHQMDLDQARANFNRATKHCDDLISVHRGHGGPGQGRRAEETSLNRAVVVITTASWQAFVQDEALAILDLSAPAPGGGLAAAVYSGLRRHVEAAVNDFATPNSHNSRTLIQGVGFDPRPHWAWTQANGKAGKLAWTPAMVDTRIDDWLKVRHAIAHGHAALPPVQALQAVRLAAGVPPANPPLRLVDAEQCLSFFRRVVKLSEVAVAGHLGLPAPATS